METDSVFAVNIAGLTLTAPFMVAAGMIKTVEQVKTVAQSPTGAVIVGSITTEARTGNMGKNFFPDTPMQPFSLNSLGLPNGGLSYYRQHLPEMAAIAHDFGKPLIVSIAGFTPQEYAILAEAALEGGADGIEVNLGCPNVWDNGEQHEITGQNPLLIDSALRAAGQAVSRNTWLCAKLSPLSNPYLLQDVADMVNDCHSVTAVTICNTFPNGFAFDEHGKPAIGVNEGLAGLAGKALKPISLGHVVQFRKLLRNNIAILGAGGVETLDDVAEYLRLGAVAVQLATSYMWHRERAVDRIANELAERYANDTLPTELQLAF